MMKRSLVLVPILAATLFLAPAPRDAGAHSVTDVGKAAVDYVHNFVHDVADIFSVGIGVGDGYALDVHATHLLDAGASAGSGKHYGLGGRGIVILGEEFEGDDHAGVTILGVTAGNNTHDNHSIGLSAGYKAGVGVSFSLSAALDAIAGLIMIDTEGDNDSLFGE